MSFFDKSKLEKHIFNNIKNKIKKLKLSKEFKESYSSKENFIKKEILEDSEIQEKIDDLIDTINIGIQNSIGNILRTNSRTRRVTNQNAKTRKTLQTSLERPPQLVNINLK